MKPLDVDASLKKYTYAVYILQALSFLLLFTAIIGLIINYIKNDDVQGSWLQTHFLWQKNTFWYGLLWTILGSLTTTILVGWVVLGFTSIWIIYRVAKGWIYLADGKQLYQDN